ncbi:MAG TPA: non-ribosomal peptide synthase/polyketide synthase [Thermoanaerobaculia bacterium]|nr:non-ribosomal peptide synthase/polyketide synthase [Thermoanaerobaculia bacterium]
MVQATTEIEPGPSDLPEPVHRHFEERARRAPDALAISGPSSLTYGELNRRANALAHTLRGLGVGPDVRVAVCLERSPELVVSVLAVLKAGGAYVALDPSQPGERLGWELEDCGAGVVLVRRGPLTDLAASRRLLCLAPDLMDVADRGPEPDLHADHLAYVIYTSGSTGRPKGVEITHRGLRSLVDWHVNAFGVTAADRATLIAGVGFDASVWEIWPYLAAGASLHVVPETVRTRPDALRDWMVAERVTVSFLPTPLAEAVVTLDWPRSTALRALLAGGDRLHQPPPAGLPFVLVNNYGPTEGTVVATSGVVEPKTGDVRPPSIGRALPHVRAFVVDGELLIGGPALARGYLGRPDLTAASFVPDPFGPPGERLYRTGDLVSELPDGELEFLGRIDDQVKIRGHRIELGEIEAALVHHPGVREAAVIAKDGAKDGQGGKRLVAYVAGTADAAELRTFLSESLPEPMVPSVFVHLEALPVTDRGKVDRRALPEPAEDARDYAAPRTPVEERLAAIWAEVLGCRVGVEDSFFELGGHSLTAGRILARIADDFGVELPLGALFAAPTVESLAAAVEASDARSERVRIERVDQDLIPLSFSQRGLWVLDRLESGRSPYTIPYAVRFDGPLDVEALDRALAGVVRRHEALRTRFPETGGEPRQEIVPAPETVLTRIDLSEAEAVRLAGAEALRRFDLANGPLLAATLVRLRPDAHLLLLTVHHIVFDGWSEDVLWREVSDLYAGRALPELPVQYADYTAWQSRRLEAGMPEQLDWWRARLAGVPPLELPADRPRPARQSFRGEGRSWSLPAPLTLAVRDLARREGATVYMTLLAAFSAVLSRLSGQEDFAVGSPVAGRGAPELAGLIGYFVNTLAIRMDLSGGPGFRSLLARVRGASLAAFEHQDLPFDRVVSALNPERDLSRNPVFQTLFQVVEEIHPLPALPGIAVSAPELHGGTAKLDLELELEDGGELIRGRCEYSADLFDAATVERLLGHLARFVEVAAAAPDRPVADLPLLAPAERHQLLAEWNDQADIRAGLPLLHQGFERQADLRPEAVALVCGGDRHTYAELEERANRLAGLLIEMGVGPEVPVGVCLRRTRDLVVAILAVLKAGGAYVPLDPDYPRERLAFTLEDSRAAVLLTQEDLHAILPPVSCTVVLDADWPEIALRPAMRPDPSAAPENLAYLIYTSGSTGRPKGVAIAHRSAAAFLDWAAGVFPDEEMRSVLMATSICFDLSVFELFGTLSRGGTVVLAANALALPGLPARGEVTLINTVPSAIAELARAGAIPDSVVTINLAGEALPGPLVDRLYETTRVRRVVNLYGPSEDTTYSTIAVVPPGTALPPIGRPIRGTQGYVLDRAGEPVPLGVAGELLLGGEGLARGYFDRPELTAERFVPDPFGASGGRLYRTGDLVRAKSHGTLMYLGRIDHQIKIRGFRVELGEIETALLRHPSVREAAVLAPGEGAERRLVAYMVLDSEETSAALRDHLRRTLPDSMIPADYVRLEALPRNPSGKVDRGVLIRIVPAAETQPETAAWTSPLEELIAGLWEDVLGRPVRPGDSFFDLGGHSLLAVRLLSRIREACGVDLPLPALFAAPTVTELARQVAEARRGALPLPELRPASREGLFPLSFPQQRLWFVDRLAPDSSSYNLPETFLLRGRIDPAALAGALSEILRRHEVLRTRYVEVDGQPWQEVMPAGPFLLPLVDLAGLPADEARREMERIGWDEAHTPFDLRTGPMLRARLVRLAELEHALLLNVHHIASDGWSSEVLHRELSALYSGSPLPTLPIQYGDFAVWQRAWPEEVLAGQLAWWTDKLSGLATLEIPTDRPRPPVQTFHGASELFAVPPRLAAALRELARARRATPFMVLLAAWQSLLHRVTGQTDVAVGSPVANRIRPEIEGLIGFFVNMLALRTPFGGAPGFGEAVDRVRRTALEAYDHADVPFERLVDELGLGRDLSRQAVVQVMFTLVTTPASVLALPGVETETLDLAGATAKFDLTLGVFERGEKGDRLDGLIEYSTDLFDRTTIARLSGHLLNLLEAVAEDPDRRLSGIDLLGEAERHQLVREWNDTAAGFPADVLMHQFFEAAVDRDPGGLAAVWDGRELTYAGLEERANRVANLLRHRGVVRGTTVGVWMERSLDMVAGVLAVLKAGGCYVPLDPAWPADRVESILAGMEAPAVLTREAHLGRVLEMQWRLPALSSVVCLDVETPEPAPEAVDTASVRAVFDLVAERAVDRVTAGGFVSSSTGLPFSEAEVDEYRDRVLSLAEPWIRPETRVLEIGSGSGLLMWEIAPRVARFTGLDPSPRTQERNRARALELGAQVELPVGFAHEIEGWAEGSFDLVLIASTAQFFPGLLYLERVIRLAKRLLAPGGAVVIADVPDARYPHKVLSVDEGFFLDLGATVLHRETGFANELRFRYDVVIGRDAEASRRKTLLTSWHVDRASAERPAPVAAPEDLAYVIHTSGSTGQPKGIVVQHRPVANLIAWINPMFGLGPSDRVLFVTSLCFDLSVWDIFGVLAAGGCVHVASEDDLRDAERLMRILLEEPVTIWDSAPAALVRLAPLFPSKPAASSRLRRVMLSGDWIPVTLPDRVRAAFPRAEVTALGGATEATVWSNWYPIGEVGADWPSIPYGRPMPNAQYRVLDAGLEPCPAGVPGNLYIGGDCLVVGYAHQPDLTAAAFIPDPFGASGARLYRTGDRARTFTDGNLEFLGRIDHQVKIRGFRIELGEIEVALARHPGVREAVVLAREDVPGDKRLVAYVVPAGGGLPDLREHLRQSLPDYMIPAAFVELEALPVTPNGKLDRRALPAPRWDSAGEEGGAPPETPTEIALAALWREVLGVDRIGVHDSFFDLGGHSLLATQLVARVREAFRVEMSLRTVFQAPTLREMAAALDAELGPMPVETTEAARPLEIRPVGRGGLLPLSFPQQRLWLVERLAPEASAYNIAYAFRLRGALDVPALEAALAGLVRRHEVLRTRFVERDGRPWQEILPPGPVALERLDLGALAPEEREAALARLLREEAAKPFDLAATAPLRAGLVRLAEGEHALWLTVHHIASDGWSEEILLGELSALYEGAELPELPVQYADYAAWQRAWPEAALREQLAAQAGRLAGLSPLELPTDRPRPPVQTFAGGSVPVVVPAAQAAALRDVAQEGSSTLFMLLLAAWQTLLHRVTGQDDVIVGSPVANRERPEVRGLVGFFVNLLPLRTDFGGDPAFTELLARVRRTALEAYDHADLPFERLVDELRLERDLSRHPVFQAVFSLQEAAPEALRLPGVKVDRLPPTGGVAQFDLSLLLFDRGDEGFAGEIEYNSALFDRATAQRLAGHLSRVLKAIADRPDVRLSEIELPTEAERHQLLVEWNDTSAEDVQAPLHAAFMARAAVDPDAVALVHRETRITYGELDARSSRLAAVLRGLGVGSEVRVGLCSARTPDLVVGILGILKAGGAYVPLDPAYPAERLAFTLEDAGVPVLVTQEELLPVLPPHGAQVVLLDRLPDAPGTDLPQVRPENLAYLIYTSGSTGRAKGVAITHGSAAAMVRWAASVFPPEDRAGVLAATSVCFDLSVFELFVPLSHGGAVILAANALELPELPAAGEVTLVNTVPSALAELVRNGGIPQSVRTVNLAGEALPGTLVAEIHERTGVERVVNLYGPSEDTTYSTFSVVPRGEAAPAIGRPVAGARAYVLDRGGRPVPVGAPGDLHLGGTGLARGYLGRPDLTAERFVPDPFGGRPGDRLYRTGDLVKQRPDGALVFLGRLDHQVKVRGFRIELGEVEAALASHPGVREAVVAVRGESLAERHLVAFVVADGERPAPSNLRLREHVSALLPGPAVPSAFVVLDDLPRTPNGKVDRRALAALSVNTLDMGHSVSYTPPATPAGEELAALWRQLLGVDRVGGADNFFELGGHSLLASQLVARIRQAFGVQLPLSAVFQAPTLDALARVVEESAMASTAGPVLRRVPRDGDGLPLSASQLRQWFLVQLEPDSVDYNLPVTVRLEGSLDVHALAGALRALARRHEALRSTFQSVGGRPVLRIAPEIDLPLPVLDLSGLDAAPGEARETETLRAAVADSDRPFDLAAGPLLRALLIRLGEAEHMLAVTVHHIVFDGFSMGVFLRELAVLYEAASAGHAPALPELTVQYADYAAWQQEWMESPALRARLDLWKARLEGSTQVLDLPTDRPRPAVISPRGQLLNDVLPAAAADGVRRLARQEGATLFMALFSGYAALLSRYTGQEDLNVGTFVANRPQPALERLIGFFVNTLVLRVDLAGDPAFRDILARVREVSLEAFDNQDLPIEALLDELDIRRDLSRAPLFQAMFGLQNFAMPTIRVPGLSLRPVSLTEHARTNGDLAFWMWEEGSAIHSLLQLSTDLLDASTVSRMFRHMGRLLEAGAADPGLRLSELPLMSAEETEQVLVEWNRPGLREPEPDQLVYRRFEDWARLRPEAPALDTADGSATLSYRELNRRANRVARRLRGLGVGLDAIVGVWAERSVEFIASILGAHKAGAAYMPLDPSLPADRLATLVRSSGISVILARDGRPAGLPDFEGEIVAVRGLDPGPEDDADPAPLAVSASLAYTFFTSGSTGAPKGVLISHGALASFAETSRRLFGIGPDDRVLQFSSLAFDISIEEIFTCFAAGSTLVLRSEEMIESPARFLRACGELDVQMIDLPTAYWHEVGVELARDQVPLPTCVRTVVFAGERALQERAEAWRPAVELGVKVFNSYGPTEATPASSVHEASEPVEGLSTNGLSIGRPMRGARLYVVDPHLRPVPPGVAGELLIGGASVGRGYAGRPDLTAERFIPSPFATVPGERVYHTGDRVRWLRDGNLEFLGRVDDQVKIRGFRIEPGEVAAVLCRHPAVREAVVVPREAPGGLRLVAYAAADPGTPVADLRTHLKETLPAYMVPSDFVILDALPLTPTGKLDRRALPEPDSQADDGSYAPPETAVEELLAEIWGALLGRERIGVYDNFFDLGGHSLLAPQVLSRIGETFQVELPLRTLFEAPTIAQMANLIEQVLLEQIEELSDEEAASLVGGP